VVIFGINPVVEALRAGRVTQIRVAGRDDQRLREILERAASQGVTVKHTAREALDRETRGGLHQGIVADVRAAPVATLEQLASADRGTPLLVVLDGIEDPQNLGAILRTVDAAGASGVVRQTRRAAPLDGAAAKASAGAVHHVAVADVVNIARALDDLKDLGVWSVGLDAAGQTPYYELDLSTPTALVVGAEGTGLRRLVRERCDFVAAIPMAGHVSSLNVAAATAIVLFEAVAKRPDRAVTARSGSKGIVDRRFQAPSRLGRGRRHQRRLHPGGGHRITTSRARFPQASSRNLRGWHRTCYTSRFVLAGVAQLVEQLICNQPVGGSSPFASSIA
jgi:23S rRNA (guanosine2251-2'-O)-methyltransferase